MNYSFLQAARDRMVLISGVAGAVGKDSIDGAIHYKAGVDRRRDPLQSF